jgi:pimeloyl-ACP methyl ester carboxylesterase
MASKPTFVMVPGAGHGPEVWDKISSLLGQQGYHSISINLPTTSGDASKSFKDDVTTTQNVIRAETSQGHNVVIIVHSYGGMVGESAMKGFCRPKDATLTSTSEGYIIGLIVIASVYAQAGMTFLDGTGGKPPPSWRFDPDGFAEIQAPARELFYHDLPIEEGDEWVAKIRKQSSKALTEDREFVYPGWQDVPVWTLLTTEDKALPLEMQKMLVGTVQDVADIRVKEIASSHSPMLSMPKEVVEVILKATHAFTK